MDIRQRPPMLTAATSAAGHFWGGIEIWILDASLFTVAACAC
jgi:hypothetical protein